MLKINKHVLPSGDQWEIIIEGMRNPMNSWDKSDSTRTTGSTYNYSIGPNDLTLMQKLSRAGTDHAKFRRMIPVYLTITAPLYWWKEFDTYKVGTVANSCSTMHTLTDREFTMDDFSHDHLTSWSECILEDFVDTLNIWRDEYLRTKNPNAWEQIIQLLPSSYNQRRTVFLNYEVLSNIYRSRRNHKLTEWRTLCDFIRTLPHAELITGEV